MHELLRESTDIFCRRIKPSSCLKNCHIISVYLNVLVLLKVYKFVLTESAIVNNRYSITDIAICSDGEWNNHCIGKAAISWAYISLSGRVCPLACIFCLKRTLRNKFAWKTYPFKFPCQQQQPTSGINWHGSTGEETYRSHEKTIANNCKIGWSHFP